MSQGLYSMLSVKYGKIQQGYGVLTSQAQYWVGGPREKPSVWKESSSESPRNPSLLGILSRKTQEYYQLLVFPLNSETTPLLSPMWGHRALLGPCSPSPILKNSPRHGKLGG